MKEEHTRIEDLKQRKLNKHFTATVNGAKVKISNFLVKPHTDRVESGQKLVLVSKTPFPGMPQLATIEVEKGSRKLCLKGRWKGALHSPSMYTEEYLITEILKQ
jgi:hypothetical protein